MNAAKTKKIVLLAMFSAIAYLTVFLLRVPFIPAVDFLKYEAKDVIIIFAGFIFGPVSAFGISLVVSLVEMMTISTTGPIGALMNILATMSFVLPSAILYKKKRTLSGAALGLVLGVVFMTVAMLMWNYFITPLYMGWPREAVAELLIPAFLPFNFIKGALNASISFLLYKPLSSALKKAKLMPEREVSNETKNMLLPFNVCAVVVLIAAIGVIVILNIGK